MIKQIFLCSFLILAINHQIFCQQDILLLKTSGKVVIGDTAQISTPGNYNLYVQRGILTEKVKVAVRNTADWSDDSFEHTPSLQDVNKSIIESKHLPSMPSAEEVVKSGYEVTSMDAKLLEQIEWLWQHMIQLKEENEKLKKKIETLEKK